MKRISVIIVNYRSSRSLACLLKCFSSISQLYTFSIIVIDPSSELPFGVHPLKDIESFTVVRTPENRGFASSLNVGLRMSIDNGVDYVWILNADIHFNDDCLSPMISVLESNENVIVGPLVLFESENSSPKIWGYGGYIDESFEVSMSNHGENPENVKLTLKECDYVPGCSMIFKPEIISEVGCFPEEYFLYFEESEWCQRAKEKAISIFVEPLSVVYHEFDQGKMNQEFRVYFYNRSKFNFHYNNLASRGLRLKYYLKIAKGLFSTYYSYLMAPAKLKLTFRAHLFSRFDFLVFTLLSERFNRFKFRVSRSRLHSLGS